jgi:hypothetical protein
MNINKESKVTHHANESLLADLNLYRTRLVKKLKKARRTLSDQQLKLKVMQTAKEKNKHSVERKMFKSLKDIGVELSLYHGYGASQCGAKTLKTSHFKSFLR